MGLGDVAPLPFQRLAGPRFGRSRTCFGGLFHASAHGWERGIVARPESTGHGLQCFRVGVERRDILRRYTSAALR